MQQKMLGRVETGEKPGLLWDHPELERLYVRLAEEYELRDRDRALDRTLDVISRTVETLLGLVQTRSSLRVEWSLVLLIVAELLLSTCPLLLSCCQGGPSVSPIASRTKRSSSVTNARDLDHAAPF